MPKISVVMSVFNGAAMLAETVDSILTQTDSDFELIVIDDASTDDSYGILERYAGLDSRVHVLRNLENVGLTRSLIAGCAAAKGTYIARHDVGDLSHPARLEREASALDAAADVVFVSCWTEFVGPALEHLYETRGTGHAEKPMHVLDPSGADALLDAPSCHPCVMFRRDAYARVGGYRGEFYYGQDWDLWYRLAALGKFQMLPEVLYRARVFPESISIGARHAQDAFAVLLVGAMRARRASQSEEPFLERARAVDRNRRGARRSRAEGFYFIGELLRGNGDPRARRYLWAAVLAAPLSPRAWLRWVQSLLTTKHPSDPPSPR